MKTQRWFSHGSLWVRGILLLLVTVSILPLSNLTHAAEPPAAAAPSGAEPHEESMTELNKKLTTPVIPKLIEGSLFGE